jgi:hypothetical protein
MTSSNKKATISQRRREQPTQLNDLEAGVDYLDPKYFLPRGTPDQLLGLEFLKACERLRIPKERWPRFGNVLLPGPAEQLPKVSELLPTTMGLAVHPLIFKLPSFDLCADDHRTWKRKANKAWRVFCSDQFGPYLRKCTKTRTFARNCGMIVPRTRLYRGGEDTIPLSLRCELAARRHCLLESWARLQKGFDGIYSLDRIRKSVTSLLRTLDFDRGHGRSLGTAVSI